MNSFFNKFNCDRKPTLQKGSEDFFTRGNLCEKNESSKRFAKKRKASAVLFVLALIFIASILVVTIAEYAGAELQRRASSQIESDLRIEAYNALNIAIAVLEEYRELDGNIYSAKQGWGEPFADGRAKLQESVETYVKISDETGKIPLRKMKSDNLILIFEEMNFSTTQAQELADCLLDWTDSDTAKLFSGAERDEYDTYAAKPPNRQLESLMELRHVLKFNELFFDKSGNPNEMFRQFADVVSVEDFEKTNLNSASENVLKMLMVLKDKEYDPTLFKAIQGETGSIDKGIRWVKNQSEVISRGAAELPDAKFITYQSTLLKIEVTVRRGIAEYYLCAFYGTEGSSSNSGGTSKRSNAANSNAKTSSGSSSGSASKASNPSSTKAQTQTTAKKSGTTTAKIIKIRERGR